MTKAINIETSGEVEVTGIELLRYHLGSYTECFLNANQELSIFKAEGKALSSEIVDQIYMESHQTREELFSKFSLLSTSEEKTQFIDHVNLLYETETGLNKRALVNIKAGLMNINKLT